MKKLVPLKKKTETGLGRRDKASELNPGYSEHRVAAEKFQ
jgi:hypothetical protein